MAANIKATPLCNSVGHSRKYICLVFPKVICLSVSSLVYKRQPVPEDLTNAVMPRQSIYCLYSSLHHLSPATKENTDYDVPLFRKGISINIFRLECFFLFSFRPILSTLFFRLLEVWWTKLDHNDEAFPNADCICCWPVRSGCISISIPISSW